MTPNPEYIYQREFLEFYRAYSKTQIPNLIYNTRSSACAHPCIRYGGLIVVTRCHSDNFVSRKTASSVVRRLSCIRSIITHHLASIAKLVVHLPPQKVQRPQAPQDGPLASRMHLTAQRIGGLARQFNLTLLNTLSRSSPVLGFCHRCKSSLDVESSCENSTHIVVIEMPKYFPVRNPCKKKESKPFQSLQLYSRPLVVLILRG